MSAMDHARPGRRHRSGWALRALAALFLLPGAVSAQDAAARVYLLAAGCHFGVPAGEVEVLARWAIPPEEIPVGLFLSARAGVSPEVTFSLRRTRTSWGELAGRYGLGASAFHVPLNGAAPGELSRAYQAFEGSPPREWDSLSLTDPEIISLVNLRFLTESLGIPASRVMDARAANGSWVAVYAAVGGRGC